VRGDAPLVIVYADYECPYCAAADARLREHAARVCFRHFPVRSAHPRALPAACAAEAAGLQGAFWEMHELLFSNQDSLDAASLVKHARTLGLDVARFDADRRAAAIAERVARDFRSGIRAGVATTPTLFRDGRAYTRDQLGELGLARRTG